MPRETRRTIETERERRFARATELKIRERKILDFILATERDVCGDKAKLNGVDHSTHSLDRLCGFERDEEGQLAAGHCWRHSREAQDLRNDSPFEDAQSLR